MRFYFDGINANDPLVTPGLFPDVLARFPPTLLVTGTRDTAMSNALVTNVRLLGAGVETQLLVLEGLGHGHFNTFAGSPESAQAYDIMWRFSIVISAASEPHPIYTAHRPFPCGRRVG